MRAPLRAQGFLKGVDLVGRSILEYYNHCQEHASSFQTGVDIKMEQLLSNKLLEWLQSDIEDDSDHLLLVASESYEKSLLSQTQNL